jgi:hypothetical protein
MTLKSFIWGTQASVLLLLFIPPFFFVVTKEGLTALTLQNAVTLWMLSMVTTL